MRYERTAATLPLITLPLITLSLITAPVEDAFVVSGEVYLLKQVNLWIMRV